jgi:hypothetical protein
VGDDNGGSEIRLIDVPSWEQVGSWMEAPSSDLLVDDKGKVYFLRSFSNTELRAVRPGSSDSDLIAELPPSFWSWGSGSLIDGSFTTFGERFEGENTVGSVVIADPASGEVSIIDLPEVHVGSLDPTNQEPWSGYLWASPSVSYDLERGRILLVHNDRDAVTEFNVDSGSAVTHELGAGASGPPLSSTSLFNRSAALSPSGATLYVASQRSEIVFADDGWSHIQTPLGVMAVDTETWEITARLVESVGEAYLSPDGQTLLGWGSDGVETESSYSITSAGLYVVAASTLDVIAHHPPEATDQWYGPFSFNEAAGVGYVSTWPQRATILVVDLDSGEIVTSHEGGDYVEMLGSIGVMSKVVS